MEMKVRSKRAQNGRVYECIWDPEFTSDEVLRFSCGEKVGYNSIS